MIPFSSDFTYVYNMVDMDGIDLADVRGHTYSGLYSKILQAVNETLTVVLYNWRCARIVLPPSYVFIVIGDNKLILNDVIVVNSDDTVEIPSMGGSPRISSLSVVENGIYNAPEGVDGYDPVTVDVPDPVIQSLLATGNGIYNAPEGVDGYNPVTVDVPICSIEKPVVYTSNSGTSNYTLDSSYSHALILIVRRGAETTTTLSNPYQILDCGAGTFPSQQLLCFSVDIESISSFSVTTTSLRYGLWIIYTSTHIEPTIYGVHADNLVSPAAYHINGFSGNAVLCIYNSYTVETASATISDCLYLDSGNALRYTYGIISSASEKDFLYSINASLSTETNSNFIFVVKY